MAFPQPYRLNHTLAFFGLYSLTPLQGRVAYNLWYGTAGHSGEDPITLPRAYKQPTNPAGLIFYEQGTAELLEVAGVWLRAYIGRPEEHRCN